LYNQAIALHKKRLLEPKGNEIHIPVLKLKQSQPLSSIVYEIIKEYGFTGNQTGEVISLFESESGKYIQSATHRIIKNRKWLIISPNQTQKASTIIIEGEGDTLFDEGKLELKKIIHYPLSITNYPDIAQLDLGKINFPLLLRKWKKGDYFYPLGMKKKKKISRFLIDIKLSLTQKEKVWVIEQDKKIIWVVGLRIDDRFKILEKTSEALQMHFTAI
jgi:tRNA(Ile)-lysidine synthase